MRLVSSWPLATLLAGWLALLAPAAQAQHRPAPAGASPIAAGQPLSGALMPAGTLRPDATGSFDATGYRMGTDPATGQPAFRPTGAGDENWQDKFSVPNLNNDVYALAVAANGDVLAGGFFTDAGGNTSADFVARWNGTAWQALGTGLNNGVIALAVAANGDVLAGGYFANAGGNASADYVARWDGTTWQALGSGLNNGVRALAVTANGDVLAGGDFANAGGNASADYVARWDGTTWQALGSGLNNSVFALAVAANGDVLVGGNFLDAGGNASADQVARWNGTTWQALGTGLNSTVTALAVAANGDVLAGGFFANAGGNASADYVARWDGTTWQALGSGLSNGVRALAVAANGDVLVGGNFLDAGGNASADYVARWNGTTWQALGSGLNSLVFALAVAANGDVLVGGTFLDAGGNASADYVARWNGTTWQALGTSLSSNVQALAVAANGDVLVGGNFLDAGGNASADYVARWNGTTWQALGSGLNSLVFALAVAANGDVLVGGTFLDAGGNASADYVVRWTGTAWQGLGSGLSDEVYTLAVAANGDVLVGGTFLDAGGNASADYVARWNGTTWQALGTSLSSNVQALAVAANGDVLVGGNFLDAGGNASADYVARWNGTTWQALGTGLNNIVSALVVAANGDVLAGGFFTDAGGNPNADYVARWTGTAWQALGSGVPGSVRALAVAANGDVLAGGGFLDAGGNASADRVARWNGTTWQALGSGLNNTVNALAVAANGDVLVGGTFLDAGGNTSADRVARWNGTAWQALSSGLNNTVSALAVAANGDVLVGGAFLNAGGNASADRVARWNGTTWQALGTGLNNTVNALAVAANGNVAAGGTFTAVGDGSKGIGRFGIYESTNAAPTAVGLSPQSVAENTPGGTAIGTFSSTDANGGDTFTYTLVSGAGSTDNAAFSINGSGQLIITAAPDFETKNSYAIRVRSTDQGSLFYEQPFTISITNVNEAPTALALSNSTVAENTGANAVVGTLSTTDPDAGNSFTYSLVSGAGSADNGLVNLNGSQVRLTADPDYETRSSYAIRVRTTDQGGLFTEQPFTLTVTNVNEAPTALTLSNDLVAENVPANTLIGTFSGTDPGRPAPPTGSGSVTSSPLAVFLTYLLVSGAGSTDNAAFTIPTSTNQLRIVASPDYEAQSSYAIRVRVTDAGGLSFEQPFTITVTDVVEDLVVSTPGVTIDGGPYNSITITGTGEAYISGPVLVSSFVLVQTGGVLQIGGGNSRLDGAAAFTLAPGAKLIVSDLDGISASGPTGAVQVTGPRTFSPHASYVYLEVVGLLHTGTGLPARVRDLISQSDGGLLLTQPVAVRRTLRLELGSLDLNGNTLTLLSDADTTAMVVQERGLAVLGNTAKVQRYLTPGAAPGLGYRHLSAPVSGSTVADLTVTGFVPKVNPAYNALPYVAPPASQFPTVFGFDEQRGGPTADFGTGYFSPASLASPLVVGRGYSVYMKPLTPDFTGTLTTGDVTLSGLTRTGANLANTAKPGWQLLGNPYPSPIDWDLVSVPTGMSASISVYKSTGGNSGGYLTRANGVGSLPAGLVPMGQAFFARVTGAGPVDFTFTNALRPTEYVNPLHYRPAAQADPRPLVQLTLRGATAPAAEQANAFVYFQAGATAGLDDTFDGAQPGHNQGAVPTLVSLTAGGEELAVNGLPESVLTAGTTVELLLDLHSAGAYALTAAQLTNLPAGAALLDRTLGTRTALVAGASYAFTSAQAGLVAGRFALTVAPASTVTGTSALSPLTAHLTVFPNPTSGGRVRVLGVAAGQSVTLLDATGRVVRAVPAAADGAALAVAGLPAGVYVVRAGALTQRLVVE